MSAGYDTTTLMGVKEIQPKFTGLFMAMFFPTVATFPTEEVAFDKIRKGVRLAPFVAPMASGRARKEQGAGEIHQFFGGVAPQSGKHHLQPPGVA